MLHFKLLSHTNLPENKGEEMQENSTPKKGTLTLGNGKTLDYVIQGTGKTIILIPWLGSFLMQFFSPEFKKHTKLIATYGMLSCEEGTATNNQEITKITTEQFLENTQLTIKALRQCYPTEKIGLLGMSILTLPAIICAQRAGADIDFLMLAGMPFFKLSLGFPESLAYFEQRANETMRLIQQGLHKKFAAIANNEPGFERLLLPGVYPNNGTLTANTLLIENFLQLAQLQCYIYQEFHRLVKNYGRGILGKVINQEAYMHFFNNIVPEIYKITAPELLHLTVENLNLINSIKLTGLKNSLTNLLRTGMPAIVISGAHDGTTPVTPAGKKLLVQLQQQYPHFQWWHFAKAGHYPMTEQETHAEFDRCAIAYLSRLPTRSTYKSADKSDLQAHSMFSNVPAATDSEPNITSQLRSRL